MDMWQLLGLKKELTVEEAAQLWTRTQYNHTTLAAEGVIKDAIEAGDLDARVVRWGVYCADLGAELPEGSINQHATVVQRADLDVWLKARGLSIGNVCAIGEVQRDKLAPATAGDAGAETKEERQQRLQARCNELKSSGVKAWQKKVADEEEISTSRLKALLAGEVKANPKAKTQEWWATSAPSSKTAK